jgi:hypothetical protein
MAKYARFDHHNKKARRDKFRGELSSQHQEKRRFIELKRKVKESFQEELDYGV